MNAKYQNYTYLLIAIFSLFSAFYNITLELHPDEAYYYIWSKNLELSYYDHPPLIAVFNKIFTLFSDSVFFIRLVAVFCMGMSAVFIYKLAQKIYDAQIAFFSVVIFLSLPITQGAFTISTIDAPLSLFWSASIYYSYLAIKSDSIKFYIICGILIGFAMLSKYTGVLILAGIFFYLLFNEPKKLLGYKPWVSVLLAFLVFMPVIIWNYQNNWISFSFQYKHGGESSQPINFLYFTEYIGNLFILFSPVFAFVLLKNIFNKEKNSYLLHSFLFLLLFFAYKALYARMLLNWFAPMIFGGVIFIAYFANKNKKVLLWGVMVSVILSLLIRFPLFFHLPKEANIKNRVFGYEMAIKDFKKYIKKDYLVCTDYLTNSAMLEYYLKLPSVYDPFTTRMSYYKFKYKDFDYSGKNCIVFSDNEISKKLKKQCKEFKLIKKFEAKKDGFKTRDFYFYECRSLLGLVNN